MRSKIGAATRAERPSSISWREVFGSISSLQGEVVATTPVMEYLCETCAQRSLVKSSLKGTPTELFFALKYHIAKGHKLTRVS